MKTRKSGLKNQTAEVRVPKEVREAEQARKKAKAAFDLFCKLNGSPAVKEYVKAQEKPSEEEQKKKQIVTLYDDFFRAWKFINDQIFIMGELSFHNQVDIPLQTLHSSFMEVDKRLFTLERKAKLAFALLGIEIDKAELGKDEEEKEAA